MKLKYFLFCFLFCPFAIFSQNITSISPNQGSQGQAIPLIISGNNMSFSGWSCWSNTGNISEFRFSQWSGTNMISGTSTNTTNQQLNGFLNISFFQNLGLYNLEVYDCSGSGWVMFPNSFQINSPSWDCVGGSCIDPGTGQGTYISLSACQTNCVLPTWDCIGGSCVDPGTGQGTYTSLSGCQTNCVLPTWDCVGSSCLDPGTGQGTYTSLSACQTNCVLPTWDCIGGSCVDPGTGQGTYTSLSGCQTNCVLPTWDCNAGSCVDPGTGQGTYASLASCQTNCNTSSIEIVSISKINIYPNPSKNIFNFSFTSISVQDLKIEILDFLGKVIYIDVKKDFIGDYSNKLNFSKNDKGIYFLKIQNNEGFIKKKLILQ